MIFSNDHLQQVTPMTATMLGLSGVGVLVVVVFMIISAISKMVKGKTDEGENESRNRPMPRIPPRPTTPPPANRPSANWEEELRRMLQTPPGSMPPPPPQRQAPPPLPAAPRPQPTIPRPQPASLPAMTVPKLPAPSMSLPKVFDEPEFHKAHCVNCGGHIEFPVTATGQVIACPHCRLPTALRPFSVTRVETMSHQPRLVTMTEAVKSHENAGAMQQRVADDMERATHDPVLGTSVQHFERRTAEIDKVVLLLRNPQSARQAIIASTILAPCKAMEA